MRLAAALALLAAPVAAQALDPAAPVEITGVLDPTRVVVRNSGRDFVCDLDVTDEAAELARCRAVTVAAAPADQTEGLARSEAASLLAGMSDRGWEQLVRQVMAGSGCRLAMTGGQSQVVTLLSEAMGISEGDLAPVRDRLFVRADRAIVTLTSTGAIRVEGGALILEECQ
ncbi:hypothetical protein [Roseisalinus antarcticus]|uniref:Uncharacterized protein n=1 Tax=Roseisalinus antarcticus TaxID=254357 RepID=A0A1Y5SKK6_9RHOB|nr:hypothetical protein [Roseisalinus antarcticus]SLN41217.1 hypothetical protein ROA7023_01638 [Roseisalinus antarcticus]